MKKKICLISLLIMSINLSGCNSATTQSSSSNNYVITYEQYIDLLYKIKDNMKFEKTNLELSESQLENQTIVIVDGNMSFGKKRYLSLNNEFEKSTQNFLIYTDSENGYKMILGFIYTDVLIGDELLYFRPDTIGDSHDMNSILSFHNIIIHLQLIPLDTSTGDIGNEHAYALYDIVSYLSSEDITEMGYGVK